MNKKRKIQQKIVVLGIIYGCLIFGLFIMKGVLAFAAEEGSLGLAVSVSDEDYQNYYRSHQDMKYGEGIYVYIQNIDTHKTYRYPLAKENNFEGRFPIAYGNYRVIADANSSPSELTPYANRVFTIGKDTPDISIRCEMITASQLHTGEMTEKENFFDATPSPQPEETKEEVTDGKKTWSYGDYFVLILIVVIAGIWLYNRKLRFRGSSGITSHEDDE